MNGWGFPYKITVSGPSQYPNTEMSPNQLIQPKYYELQLRLSSKD